MLLQSPPQFVAYYAEEHTSFIFFLASFISWQRKRKNSPPPFVAYCAGQMTDVLITFMQSRISFIYGSVSRHEGVHKGVHLLIIFSLSFIFRDMSCRWIAYPLPTPSLIALDGDVLIDGLIRFMQSRISFTAACLGIIGE